MIDNKLVGETAVKLMDAIERDAQIDSGEILAVGIVVCIKGEDFNFIRVECSDGEGYRQSGLFHSAYRLTSGIDGYDDEDGNDAS